MATRPMAQLLSYYDEPMSPITKAKNVLTDDGQNLQDILSDRKEDMMTPTIENSSSMFKVGQGDSVDYSENVVDGTYESCVLKGKSLVNLLTKTLDTTWNLNLENWNIVSTVPSDYVLKPSTTYSVIVYVTEKTCPDREDLFWVGDVDGKKDKVTHDIVRKNVSLGANVFVINTVSDFSSVTSVYSGGINFQGSKFVEGTLKWKAIVLEGDWTNKELPPYFEGICDCKSPILTNVGKNLLPDSVVWTPNRSINDAGNTAPSDNPHWHTTEDYLPIEWIKVSSGQCRISYETDNLGWTNVVQYDDKKVKIVKTGSNNSTGFKFTVQPNAKYFRLSVSTYKLDTIMIEEGLTASSYEPHKSNTVTFSTDDNKTIVLRSLPNGVCDTLNVETGEYVQRIGETVLDGSDDENWSINNTEGTTTNRFISHSLQNSNVDQSTGVGQFLCDKLKTEVWNQTSRLGLTINGQDVFIYNASIDYSASAIKQWLSQNPITVQYELATPITKTVDLSGYPFAYKNGHVQLSSGSIEQSLLPTIEYSVVTNRNGQIRGNQKMVERHQKELDRLQAMILANLVNTQYEQTLTNLKYELSRV